jgi:hypothetical protein
VKDIRPSTASSSRMRRSVASSSVVVTADTLAARPAGDVVAGCRT